MIGTPSRISLGQLNAFRKNGVEIDEDLVGLTTGRPTTSFRSAAPLALVNRPGGVSTCAPAAVAMNGSSFTGSGPQQTRERGNCKLDRAMKRIPRLARHVAIGALFLALISFKAATSWASCQKSGDRIDVAVGLRAAPPFISADSIRGQRGLNFDLWMSIEREFQKGGLIGKTEFVECPLSDQLRALAAGDLDLVISPLTITAERMDLFDFTHQYLSSGITVAQRSSSAIDFGYAIGILRETITHRGVARAILIFLVINLFLAAFMARVLRREQDFPVIATEPIPVRFYRYTMEAVVRTIGLKGIGDGLRSTATRTLEVFMAVVGTALSAAIFGVLTTALIGSIGVSPQIKPGDLPKLRVATLANSTSQAFLEQLRRDAGPVEGGKRFAEARASGPAGGDRDRQLQLVSSGRGREPAASAARNGAIVPQGCLPYDTSNAAARCVTTATWREAMQILTRGEVDVVLGDWAQLTYLSRLPDLVGKVTVQASTFRIEPYGWGVSRRRPELRAAIDRALVTRLRNPEWRFLVNQYMGPGSISPE